jgi:hypothetical protein
MKRVILLIWCAAYLNAGELFTELTYGYQAVETTKIYGEEPLENIVGGDSTRIELLVGTQYIRRGYSSGSDLGSSIFGYGWVNDEKKNNEIGLGLGMKIEAHSEDFSVYIAGKSGIGYQDVKGERFELDTNANKMSYVFGVPAQHGDFVGIYTDDTYMVDIELELGTNSKLTDHLSAVVSVSYLAQWYSFSYRVVGGGSTDLSGYGQDSYVARAGLNYRF